MLTWLFSPKPEPSRIGAAARILDLFVGLVPIDGDFGRARPAKDRAAEADAHRAGPAAGREDGGSRHPKRAVRPALPTHARNAVEEWIPSAILYGPPR